uniref:Late blight resistance protein n=1 Tax=Solanum tuberosum TaxID=4113 RepID=M1E0Q9_SOLTU
MGRNGSYFLDEPLRNRLVDPLGSLGPIPLARYRMRWQRENSVQAYVMFSFRLACLYIQCTDAIWPASFYDAIQVPRISVQRFVDPVEHSESVVDSLVPFVPLWREFCCSSGAATSEGWPFGGPRTSETNSEWEGSSFLVFQACFEMVNTRYNGVRPVAPINAPAEESATRGRGRGKGRRSVGGRDRGTVAPVVNEVSIDNFPMNKNPPEHN